VNLKGRSFSLSSSYFLFKRTQRLVILSEARGTRAQRRTCFWGRQDFAHFSKKRKSRSFAPAALRMTARARFLKKKKRGTDA